MPPAPPFIALKTDPEVESYSKWSPSFLRVKVKGRNLVQLGLLPFGRLEHELESMWTPPTLPWSTRAGPTWPWPMVPLPDFLLEPSKTFQNIPNHSRTFRNNSRTIQYMNLILRTIPDLLMMSRIPSETPNNLRSPKLLSDNSHIYSKRHLTLSVSPYGSRMMQT